MFVAAVMGCGGFGYHPFTVIEPETHADSSIVVASLHLRIHVADERLDLRLTNTGADTIVVNWPTASFTIAAPPDDEIPHRLIRSATFSDAAPMSNGSRAVAFATPAYDVTPFPDQAALRLPPDDEHFTLAPHEVRDETLYPAEHVRARPDGRWIVGPLLCTPASRSQRRITVSFQALIDGRWRTISAHGVVSP